MTSEREPPNLFDLQDDADRLATYFDALTAQIREQHGVPVDLVEAAAANRLSIGIGGLIAANREHNRYWKHRDPDDIVLSFARSTASFLEEHGLTWEELEERLGFRPGTFHQIKWFAEDEE